MASFKGVIIIDGKERNLLRAEYTFFQLKDITGNPITSVQKTPFYATVESSGFDSDLYHYMFSPNACFSGEIIFYDRGGFKILYKVEFHKAYIVELREEFDHNDNLPLHINLSITCGAVKIKDVKKIEMWVPNDPFVEVEPTVLNNEKKVTSYYLTNTDNQEIQDYKENDIIILNIETLNRIGDIITINLDDNEYDFEYNGNLLPNDTLSNIEISSDLEQIKLKVIKQKQKSNGNSKNEKNRF